MKTRTFHFFKAGTHTTSAAQAIEFTEGDLSHSALAYDPKKWLAPLVINHPGDDAPVLGVVRKLTAKGGNLYATAEFSESLLRQGAANKFKGVSAKWFRPLDAGNPRPGAWYLRHIGFLDTVNPAVKGLDPVAFSECSGLGALFDSCNVEVSFSEAPATLDYDTERQVLHAMAQKLVARDKLSFAAAAHQADRLIQQYKARRSKAQNMDPERVEFHEASLDYMDAIPGTSYVEAMHLILSLSSQK